ncbi:hypothetical protein ANTPLA_LOCUS6686 [Anthophora plagiata]
MTRNPDQNIHPQYRGTGHNCQGPRCVCQRYENGEVVAAVMNQNRNNQERDDTYQNISHGSRGFQNRPGGSVQVHPNLNPNYQNPVDLVHNYNRNRQQQEPEENIYERLDNDDDDGENAENNSEVVRNEPLAQNNQNNVDDHTYERIDDRYSCGGRTYSRCYKYHILNHYIPNFLNDMESRNQYDQSRQLYLDSSRLSNQFCQNRLGRLGRNCFSTENIAYASTGRAIYPLGHNCACSFCRHLDTRYVCHHCHNLHNRLRHQDGFTSNSRHYIYQLPRNCRCPFCRGEYSYVKLPVMPYRPTESLRMECHCRNPNNCSCRSKVLPNCNSSTQFSRYLDWISRGSPSVNNPLYATVHIGRPCVSALGNTTGGGNLSNSIDPGASTSNMSAPTSTVNESSASNVRLMFPPHNLASHASVCPTNRSTERQHTCDDSCIRNQSGSVTGICQFLGRCERAECNHSRLSVHWWFINRWLPPWNPHYSDRNMDTVSSMEEEPREQHETDSDDT